MSQDPQPRHLSDTDNRNNHGVIGNGSGIVVNSGQFINQFNIIQVTNAELEDIELDRLLDGYISKDALHNSFHSPPDCYTGTRKTVRKEIGEWIDDSSSTKSPLLWLNGPAAVGKSVIAKTIAASHDQVVATFFFSTSSDRSAATLFPTLAWQLARSIPETKPHIIASLKNNGSLLTSEIKEQFDHLIALSLKKCTMTSKSLPVMIIDGIDECTDEYMLSRTLQVLVRAGEGGDMPLRFIICSRPEPRIRAILKKLYDRQETKCQSSVPSSVSHSLQRRSFYWHWRPQTWIQSLFPDIRNCRSLYTPIIWGFRNPALLLQESWKLYRPLQRGVDKNGPLPEIHGDLLDRISPHPVVSYIQIGFSEECKEDIARYLTDQFNAMGHQLGESDISHLVSRSCGQFLYASTIVRLLEDSHPKDVLEMMHKSSLPTPNLNKLYKIILKRAKDAIRNRAQEGGPDYEKELRILMDTLAILVVFAENLHFFEVRENFVVIESLVGLEKGQLTTKLFKMNSIVDIVPGKSISVYHRSFLEFLQTQKRSGEYYVAYPKALRRFLILQSRVGLRSFVMEWFGQILDNDRKMCEDVKNMALACRRNYFKRSYSPMTLIILHDSIHCFLPLLSLVPFCQFMCQFKESLVGAPTSSSTFGIIMEYLLRTFFCLFILFSGSFIISLTIYTWFFNRSFVLPLFHPFLHPQFVTMFGIFLSSRQPSTQSENHMVGGQEPINAENHQQSNNSQGDGENPSQSPQNHQQSNNSQGDGGNPSQSPQNHQQSNNSQGDGENPSHSSPSLNAENHQRLNNSQGTETVLTEVPVSGLLYEYIERHRLGKLAYDDYAPHPTSPSWISKLLFNGETFGHGQAITKDEAEERAAANALEQLKDSLRNSRELLYKYIERHRLGELTYEDYDQLSPSKRHIWISNVQLNGKTYGQGQGTRKSEARESAAAEALAALRQDNRENSGQGQASTKGEAKECAAANALEQPKDSLGNSRELLNNYIERHRLGELTYEDYDQLSPSSRHIWVSKVQLNGKTYGQGQGRKKVEARESAAAKALAALRQEYGNL